MYYITKKDAEIVNGLTFFFKLSEKVKKLHDQLEKKSFDNPQDIDAAFSLAVFNLLILDNTNYIADVSYLNTDTIFESFNRVLALKNDFWLAWLLKCMFMSAFPPNIAGRSMLEVDAKKLIDMQENSRQEPYYIVPYMILADFYFTNHDEQKAIGEIENGLSKIAEGEIIYLADYLSFPFKKIFPILKNIREQKLIEKLNERCKTLFPRDRYFQ